MRHLPILFLLLVLIPSPGLASQGNETCDVLLFPADKRSLFIKSYYNIYSVNNRVVPVNSFNDSAFLIKDLPDGSIFKIVLHSTSTHDLSLSCSKHTVLLDVDNYANFRAVTEEKAASKLHEFKKMKTLERKGKGFIVSNEKQIDETVSIAEAVDSLRVKGQADKQLILSKKEERINSKTIKEPPSSQRLPIAMASILPTENKLIDSSQLPSSSQELSESNSRFTWEKAPVVNRNAVAVIIGNKNYAKANKGVPDVDYALNDAEQIYQYVTKSLGYREGNVIYLKDATQADLISTFGISGQPKGKLFDWLRPGKSEVFIYYSGHGAPSLSNGQGFFLPVDADPQRVELNGYSLQTFYKNLAQLPAKSVTVVMDACFSGSSQSGTVVKNASSISLRLVEAKNILHSATVLAAADVTEVASWDTSAKHGLFTRYFLEGVSGDADNKDFGNSDGKVTLGELKAYLEDNVTYFARRNFSREQHPQVSGNLTEVMSSP